MAGDGSVEWVHEPMQTSVLLDVADMLDELELWHRLTAGIELPEYQTAQFQPKDLERENAKLRELCCEMFKEHQRIYHAGGTLKMGPSATNKQMAHWYSECMRWGVEVDE